MVFSYTNGKLFKNCIKEIKILETLFNQAPFLLILLKDTEIIQKVSELTTFRFQFNFQISFYLNLTKFFLFLRMVIGDSRRRKRLIKSHRPTLFEFEMWIGRVRSFMWRVWRHSEIHTKHTCYHAQPIQNANPGCVCFQKMSTKSKYFQRCWQ